MNRHLTFPPSARTINVSETGPAEVLPEWRQSAPATPPVWRHTLVLSGNLSASSTTELQEEIECLYQEGVTSLVLDLRRLESIESSGVQAIASLSVFYKRRGIGVSAIGASAMVHHALMAAEAANDSLPSRRFSRFPGEVGGSRSTETIRQL